MSQETRRPEPAVYARLSAEAEVKLVRRTPHRAARWLGIAIAVAIVVVLVVALAWTGT